MANEEQNPATEEQSNLDESIENTAQEQAVELDSESSEATTEPEELSPEAQIESLQVELAKTKDDALRMVADAQNIKRRAEADIDKARKFALEKFSNELLVVADNLERALSAADLEHEKVKPLAEGVELTQKSFIDILAKFNVEQLDPVGEPFDPQFHQAMSMVENPDAEPNSVTLVMQKGYTLNGRLLRPAMVMVAKAAAGSVDETA